VTIVAVAMVLVPLTMFVPVTTTGVLVYHTIAEIVPIVFAHMN